MIIKKIFIISSVLLLIVLVFFGVYTIAFKNGSDVKTKKETQKPIVDIEPIVSEKVINITSDPIVSATVGSDGETIRYYDAVDGRAWTMTTRGTNKEVLVAKTKGIPLKAQWSQNGESVILTYKNGEIYVYNHTTGVEHKLRDGMDDVVWAGVGGKILYKYYDKNTKERSLNIANADGTNWKKIANIPFRYATFVQIPSSILAAFWPTAKSNISTQLFTTSTIYEGEPHKIFEGKNGADFLFSPNGKKVIVSSVQNNGKKITLGVMDADGKNYNDLIVPTIVQKVVWSKDGKTVYYAQPNDVPSNVVWPDDYNTKKFTTHDTFYKMDVTTGKKERIIELDEITEQLDATDLFLSPAEDVLFFTNRVNGLLYRLNL